MLVGHEAKDSGDSQGRFSISHPRGHPEAVLSTALQHAQLRKLQVHRHSFGT